MVIIILLDKLPAGAAFAKCSSYAVTAAAVLCKGNMVVYKTYPYG